jgi:hypothetical protein
MNVLLGIRDLDAILVLAFVITLIAQARAYRRLWVLWVWNCLFAGGMGVIGWLVLFRFFEPDREHLINAIPPLFILVYLLPQLWGWQPFRISPSKELELNRKLLELCRKLFGEKFAERAAQARRERQQLVEEAERRGVGLEDLVLSRLRRR